MKDIRCIIYVKKLTLEKKILYRYFIYENIIYKP